MTILFTHNWIYYALSVCIGTLVALQSVRLFFFLVLLIVFMIYKREHKLHIVLQIVLCIFTFLYVSKEYRELQKPVSLPNTFTWTDHYKINGNMLKGFMKDKTGRKIYVSYQIKTEKEKEQLSNYPLVGKKVYVEGTLEEPKDKAHEYAFDMKQYLKSEGAIGIVEIKRWEFLSSKPSFYDKICRLRFQLKQHIEKTFPHSLASEAEALLIGERENVDPDVNRAYQKLGITHLFAISGLHVAIMVAILYEGLLFCTVRKQFALIILLISLPVYGILAGGAPSVWRAVAVVELVLLGKFKKLSIDDALSISFILFLFLDPFVIYQIGFQLSYLATFSLIYSGNILERFQTWWSKTFMMTFLCQLIVYPLLLLHFYELSLSSFFVNILFVPLFSFIILPINLFLFLLTLLPLPIDQLFFNIYEPFRNVISLLIDKLQAIPNQMWIAGKPSKWLIGLAYISVFLTFYYLDVKEKWWKIVAVLIIPPIIIHFHSQMFQEIKISFINVGQGDSILIELPYQKEVYLIDTGGVLRFQEEDWKKRNSPYEVGRQVVVPYLKGKGISKIDKLILTHGDSDHMEGAEEIVKEISVEEIHVTPNSLEKEVYRDLLQEVKKRNIPIKEQMAGMGWKVSDVEFHYVWPMDTVYEGNNDSLVLYMKRGNFDALFTGDLEQEGEKELIKQFPEIRNIDLLKAGHHGSKTSSSEEFLKQVMPKITIFSAGENNRYNHPHQEVVERFKSLQLQTFSTKKHGTIEIFIRDEHISVKMQKNKAA